MISVLIPVYNCSITNLVSTLENQLTIAEIPFEVVIIDDGSELSFKEENRTILSKKHINYSEFSHNKGRIAIRNELMKKAAFDWLLFLDADSVILKADYLRTYQTALNENWDVIVGGRVYDKVRPANSRLLLHWTYGSKREVQLSNLRSRKPYVGFMSNNFLIKRDVFHKLKLSDSLTGYGHEDTWMGIQLEKLGVTIHHIDNPVLHNGIEDVNVFIDKSLNGLRNLQRLEKIVGEETLKEHVKLYAAYCRLKRLGILPTVNCILSLTQRLLLKNLYSSKPSLFLFDLYRLHNFSQIAMKGH